LGIMSTRAHSTASAPGSVLIAGGGIGGLSAALALAQSGIASHVLERRRLFGPDGAGIQIGPNGTKVLAQLGLAGQLSSSAAVPEGIRIRDAASGSQLGHLPLGRWISERHGSPYWTLHRRDLHEALLAAAVAEPLITISNGTGVADAREERDRVVVTADDGRHWTGDALVAADGVWSTLRSDVFAGMALAFTGKRAARAVIPASSLPSGLSHNEVNIWLAPAAHVVHYPISAGREVALVAVFDGQQASVDWSTACEPSWVQDQARSFALPLRDLLSVPPAWRAWSLQSLPRWPQFAHGRMALLGDAAHPVLPFLAQGGVLALEDAVVLADCLGEDGSGEVAERLEAYNRLRHRRARNVARASHFNGRIYHLSGLAAELRNRGFAMLPAERLMGGYDWLYGWAPP
jgi:salicylate hydroxylase